MDEYLAEYFEWMKEARRIAAAEVDRAVREFESGEDVKYPCYSSITNGRMTRHFNGEMRVIYPAGKPVIGTLSTKVVEEPPTGRTCYFTNALIPRKFVKLDVPRMRARALWHAENMAKLELRNEHPNRAKLPKLVHMVLWNGYLREDFARCFSAAAKAYPGKLETFVTHQHLVKCGDDWQPLVM